MTEISIHFDGPFTFVAGDRSLFHSRHAQAEGIYLWTIQQKDDLSHMIHYVGETANFGKRHREHLIQILAMNYGIFDPDEATFGRCQLLWHGLWRDKGPDSPGRLLSEYRTLTDTVLRYLATLSVFFAPTQLDPQLRKHLEGCIGWHLRNQPPEANALYPDDNRVTKRKNQETGTLSISCGALIRGLERSILY